MTLRGRRTIHLRVIPAEAGIQFGSRHVYGVNLDPDFRRDDAQRERDNTQRASDNTPSSHTGEGRYPG